MVSFFAIEAWKKSFVEIKQHPMYSFNPGIISSNCRGGPSQD